MGASDFAKLPHIGESLRRKEDYRFLTGAGARMLVTQVNRAHDHAGGAKAALQAMAILEGRLHRVHGAVGRGQAFDGGDLSATGLGGQNVAGFDRAAIHDHGTGAALCCVTADVGASELQVAAQGLYQQGVGGNVQRHCFAVDLQLNLHVVSPMTSGNSNEHDLNNWPP